MRITIQIAIIFFICIVGELISLYLPFSFPGTVISMILMFLLLLSKRIEPNSIKETSDFLLNNMAFFFLPTAAQLVVSFEILRSNFIAFLIICFVTTIITFMATAYTVILVIKLQNNIKKRKGGDLVE